MAFTEICCRSGGSNLNAGTLTGNSTEPGTSPTFTAVGDSDGTSVFTPSDGSTPASTVSAGMFAAVFVTAGATVSTFTGRITVVAAGVNGAITFSTIAKSGTFPTASAGAHTITMNVGGALKGPNAASGFPFNFVTAAMTNAAGSVPRVNLKNDATYSITAAVTHSLAGPIQVQGYTTAYGDGGRATIDGGTSGASYILLTVSNVNVGLFDLIFSNNGASGSASALTMSNNRNVVRRCVVHDVRGSGIDSDSGTIVVGCEAYACNQSATASKCGILANMAVRCFSHDNAGASTHGFVTGGSGYGIFDKCVADTNGGNGFSAGSSTITTLINCDAYNNGAAGAQASTKPLYAESSNFVLNATYGIDGSASAIVTSVNCGYGSGTKANTSGTINPAASANDIGSVTYAANVTPWVDPANGDFRITLSTAKGTGEGSFTQTAASYTGTVAYPDIGAAQSRGGGLSRSRSV